MDKADSLYQRLNSTRSRQRPNINSNSNSNSDLNDNSEQSAQILRNKRTKSCNIFQYEIEPPINTEKLVRNRRKQKEDSVLKWITEENPDSLEILKKIGEISPTYEKVLNLICEELEKIPVHQRQEFSNEKAQQEIQLLNSQRNSLGLSLEALETKRNHLEKEVNELEAQYATLVEEANHYNDIVQQLSYNSSEDFQLIQLNEEFQKIKEEKVLKTSLSSKRNDIMGQNHHLWFEKKRLLKLIEEEREQQLQYIHQKALQQLFKNQEPEQSTIKKKMDEIDEST